MPLRWGTRNIPGSNPVPAIVGGFQADCLFVLYHEMAATNFDDVVTTKLLTLLNISATKIRKRKCDFDDSLALPPVKKMGGKRVVVPNVAEELKESEKKPEETGKEGFMVEINHEKDAESATSFVSSFSRFSSKAYPSRILGTL